MKSLLTSRKGYNLLSGLSSIGLFETGYLSFTKITDGQAFCPSASVDEVTVAASRCQDILNGPFSVVPLFDVPIVYIGFVSYAAVLLLSNYLQLTATNSLQPRQGSEMTLLAISLSMGSFSTYLWYILTSILHADCPYCLVSIALSLSIAFISANTFDLQKSKTVSTVVGASSISITGLFTGLLFYVTNTLTSNQSLTATAQKFAANVGYLTATATATTDGNPPSKASQSLVKVPPAITTSSTKRSLDLAQKLKQVDAKMYGAYWCSHCYNQVKEIAIIDSNMNKPTELNNCTYT